MIRGMVIVHGIIPIKPARREQALSLAREVSAATRNEEGCVSYEFYVGLTDPNTLILLQEWESIDALSSHFRTPHTRAFIDALPDVLAGKVFTRRYTVQEERAPPRPKDEAPPPIIH